MNELYKKLFELQKQIKPIVKDETNPHFKNKYFDINSLVAELRPIINELGLLVMQPLTHIDGKPAIETKIIDVETGDCETRVTPLIDLQDAQKLGGAITYLRRYCLVSWLLLEAEDDDGNTAVGNKVERDDPLDNLNERVCVTCKELFTPKPGTEAYANKCAPCYAKSKK